MNAQAAAARREYKRKWARENPEKVRAQQERYWTKKATQAGAPAVNDPQESDGMRGEGEKVL